MEPVKTLGAAVGGVIYTESCIGTKGILPPAELVAGSYIGELGVGTRWFNLVLGFSLILPCE